MCNLSHPPPREDRGDAVKRWLHLLPCTSVELAAELDTTVRLANSRLQTAKRLGLVRHTYRKAEPLDKHAGRWPYIWERP